MPLASMLSALFIYSLTYQKPEPIMCQAQRTWQLKNRAGANFTALTKSKAERL